MSRYDQICLSTDALESIMKQLQSTRRELQSQQGRIRSVCSQLDRESGSEVRVSGCKRLNCGASVGSGKVKSVLSDYRDAVNTCSEGIDDLAAAVGRVRDLLADTERNLIRQVNAQDTSVVMNDDEFGLDDLLRATGAAISSTVDKVKNAFWDMVDNWKTGASMIVGKIKDVVSAFKADWEAKGYTYRVIKGLGAIANIVIGSVAVVGAVTGTGITAGAGAPATFLIGLYGANTAANGFADLYNCITGNVDAVGEVDFLKSGLTMAGGQVGEWLGNREMGENIGEVTYIVGGLATAVVSIKNLSGQIKQSKTAASTLKQSASAAKDMLSGAAKEVPQALDDLGYLVTKCDVRDLPYQFSQFAKTIPNITNVLAEAKLVQKGVSSAQTLIDAGVESVNKLAGWEMLKQPSFFGSSDQSSFINSVKETKDILSSPGESVDSIIEGIGDIKNAFAVAFI